MYLMCDFWDLLINTSLNTYTSWRVLSMFWCVLNKNKTLLTIEKIVNPPTTSLSPPDLQIPVGACSHVQWQCACPVVVLRMRDAHLTTRHYMRGDSALVCGAHMCAVTPTTRRAGMFISPSPHFVSPLSITVYRNLCANKRLLYYSSSRVPKS